ncbi:35200_t:CDS:2, partial [Gigaspora margarita]
VGEGLQNLIIKADISDINMLIESDHKLVWAEATEENWESYSKCVDTLLRKKEIYNLEETAQSNEVKIKK